MQYSRPVRRKRTRQGLQSQDKAGPSSPLSYRCKVGSGPLRHPVCETCASESVHQAITRWQRHLQLPGPGAVSSTHTWIAQGSGMACSIMLSATFAPKLCPISALGIMRSWRSSAWISAAADATVFDEPVAHDADTQSKGLGAKHRVYALECA
eukprot:scaffold1224_cov392-Prasinococcus_capsulatus_cf.AAC.3